MFEILGVNQIVAACVADFFVDNEQFAMVTQVAAGKQGFEYAHGQSSVDLYACMAQGAYPTAAEKVAAAHGICQDDAVYATLGSLDNGLEQGFDFALWFDDVERQ